MDDYPLIDVPTELVVECMRDAKRMAAGFAAGLWAKSRSVSTHGMESNVADLTRARIAEVAHRIYYGLDPRGAFRDTIDSGFDIIVPANRVRADVKAHKPWSQWACWPVGKNRLYPDKQFDVLTWGLVEGTECWLAGWMTKEDFFRRKMVAGPNHKLDEGTWHVPLKWLEPIATLRELRTADAR